MTVALDRAVRVLKVVAFAERRGSAIEARALCETLEPAIAPPPSDPRDAAGGRPAKRERRALGRLYAEDDE